MAYGDWQKNKVRSATRVDGKYVTAYGKNKTEADRILAVKIDKIKQGQLELAGNMTVNTWFERYCRIYKSKVTETTRAKMVQKVKKFLLNEIGNKPLKLVKPADLQEIMNGMEGYSDDYIKKVYEYMKDIFGKAVDNDLIIKSPMRSVTRPSGGKTTHRDITEEEKQALLEVTKYRPEYIKYALIYYCGCRPAEADNIFGKDIQGDYLHIRGTKTKDADRHVPIPNSLKAYLKEYNAEDNVITGESKNITPYQRRRLWHDFRNDMNEYMQENFKKELAKDFVPYCLRHAYCCILLRSGVPLKTAMTLMGHSDYKMILTVYQHTDEKMIEEAAKLINANV